MLKRVLPMCAAALCAFAPALGDEPSTYPGMDQLDPDPENLNICAPLPLEETFSEAAHYSGDYVPTGWLTTGTTIFVTANTDDLPAAAGTWYLLAPESTFTRDENVYTPFFHLKSGVEYTISFATSQDPTEFNGVNRITTINLKAGTQQDADFHPVTIAKISQPSAGKWVRHSYTFTPAKEGAYCFSFQLEGEALSGSAAIDDVTITSVYDHLKVKPRFHPHGLFAAGNGAALCLNKAPILLANYTEDAFSADWTCDNARIENLDNGDAYLYPEDAGKYNVTLIAENEAGPEPLTKGISVEAYETQTDELAFTSYDPNAVKYFTRSYIPAFGTDPYGLDYASGPNHYYSKMAEYFPAPADAEFTIRGVQYLVTSIRYAPVTSQADDQYGKTVKFKVYTADANGCPDKLIGTHSATMSQVYGNIGPGNPVGDLHSIDFRMPMTVTGPFCIAMEFSESLIIDPIDPAAGRTFASIGMTSHPHGRTTLMCKPYKVPSSSKAELDEWCPVSALNSGMQGFGLNMTVKASYRPGQVGVDTERIYSLKPVLTGGLLSIEGLQSTASLQVFSVSGSRVYAATAQPAQTFDLNSLPAGMYLVKVGEQTFKIVK